MKRINLAIMALTILMALTQCKKQEQASSDSGETVFISLQVGGSNGSKADVNPDMGTVVFTQGDVVYVSSDGKFVGTLTHNGNTFSGNITNPLVGQPLYFYFFGNKPPVETLSEGSSTQCSVLVSDQTTSIPVISCGPSREVFTGSGLYTAFFYNKCALVKFDVAASSTSATCLTGLNNKVIVDFANNNVSYGQENDGLIKLNAGNGEKWAILLPQAAMEAGDEGSAYSEDGNYMGVRPAIPAITENGYLTEGIAVSLQSSAAEVPEGAVNGLFTVNANGDQVYFSKGNLQYIGSAAVPYWKFADNQWDCFGTSTGQNSSNQNVDRDLFGWGTSGYNHGATAYQPWSTSTTNSQYYAYGNYTYNLYDQTGQADWGYNAISNGGNTENSGWRTPTSEEWAYIFNTRSASTVNDVANARFAKAKVADVQGMILFPDDYTHPSELIQPIGINNTGNTGWNSNNYTEADFALMESNGAVFLPAAGDRSGTNVIHVGTDASYWSSTCVNNSNAYHVLFYNSTIVQRRSIPRKDGDAVRLIRDAE